jgi:hypothetical protein
LDCRNCIELIYTKSRRGDNRGYFPRWCSKEKIKKFNAQLVSPSIFQCKVRQLEFVVSTPNQYSLCGKKLKVLLSSPNEYQVPVFNQTF